MLSHSSNALPPKCTRVQGDYTNYPILYDLEDWPHSGKQVFGVTDPSSSWIFFGVHGGKGLCCAPYISSSMVVGVYMGCPRVVEKAF